MFTGREKIKQIIREELREREENEPPPRVDSYANYLYKKIGPKDWRGVVEVLIEEILELRERVQRLEVDK